jgi:hypothetical protein
MIRLALMLAAVGTGLAAQQASSIDKWQTLGDVCGRVVRNASSDPSSHENLRSVSGAVVQLYKWRKESACCTESIPLAETKSRRSGEFEFRELPPGHYWLLVRAGRQQYAMAISYKSNKDDFGSCSDHLFTIERSGDFALLKTIHVD